MKKLGITILILCALGCCVGGGYYITTQKNNSQQSSQGKLISNNPTENTNLSTGNTKTSILSDDTNTSANNLETNTTTSPNSSTNQIGKVHSFTNLSQKTNNTKNNTANNTTDTSPLNNTNISNSNNNNNLVNATTLPSDLSTINIAAGDYYFALGNKASQLAKPVSEVREMIYNAVKNKITNTGYINLTKNEEEIVSHGTSAQKEELMKKLGANSLLINVTYNTNFPISSPNVTIRPENFTGGQFYYSFLISTLQDMCKNINNWSEYKGFISTNGTLLTNSQFKEACTSKNFYYLNLQQPAYPEYFKLNV